MNVLITSDEKGKKLVVCHKLYLEENVLFHGRK